MGLVSLQEDIEDRRAENGSNLPQAVTMPELHCSRFPNRASLPEIPGYISKWIEQISAENRRLSNDVSILKNENRRILQRANGMLASKDKAISKMARRISHLQWTLKDLTGHLRNAERKIDKLEGASANRRKPHQ